MPDLVHVLWRDSVTSQGWHSFDDAKARKIPPCESVGFLVAEDKDRIALAGSIDTTGPEIMVNNTIVIPRESVQEIRKLRKDGKRNA